MPGPERPPRPPRKWQGAPGEAQRRNKGMPDARRYTKCSSCGDLLWFDSWDAPPQSVICTCGETLLTEDDITGSFTTPSQAEIDFMEGVE